MTNFRMQAINRIENEIGITLTGDEKNEINNKAGVTDENYESYLRLYLSLKLERQVASRTFSRSELMSIQDANESLFLAILQEWCNGEYILCKDNFEDLAEQMIYAAKDDGFENEEQFFNRYQDINEYHRNRFFYTFRAENEEKTEYLERVYERKNLRLIGMNLVDSKGKSQSVCLDLDCLGELTSRNEGDYCTLCGEFYG